MGDLKKKTWGLAPADNTWRKISSLISSPGLYLGFLLTLAVVWSGRSQFFPRFLLPQVSVLGCSVLFRMLLLWLVSLSLSYPISCFSSLANTTYLPSFTLYFLFTFSVCTSEWFWVCECVYAFMCMYMYEYMYMCKCVNVRDSVYVYLYVCVWVCVCVYAFMYVWMSAQAYVCACV